MRGSIYERLLFVEYGIRSSKLQYRVNRLEDGGFVKTLPNGTYMLTERGRVVRELARKLRSQH